MLELWHLFCSWWFWWMMPEESGLWLGTHHGMVAILLTLWCHSFCSLWGWPLRLLSRLVSVLFPSKLQNKSCTMHSFLDVFSCREYQTGFWPSERWFLGLWSFSFGVSYCKVSFCFICIYTQLTFFFSHIAITLFYKDIWSTKRWLVWGKRFISNFLLLLFLFRI